MSSDSYEGGSGDSGNETGAATESVRDALRQVGYYTAILLVLIAAEYIMLRFLDGTVAVVLKLLLVLAQLSYILTIAIGLRELYGHARSHDRLSVLVSFANVAGAIVFLYGGYKLWNWDIGGWMVSNLMIGDGIFRPEFAEDFNRFYGILLKAIGLLSIALGFGVVVREAWRSWPNGEIRQRV